MLQNALSYARRGLSVLPLNGKIPVTPNGLKDATSDINTVAQLWTRWPQANIGIRTGERFWALDIDGPEGEASLRGLQERHGALSDTVEVITGTGGRHLYFNAVAGLRNRAGVLLGIDVRSEGGYVVSPPSIHPNGRQYIWGPNCANTIANAPGWLIDLVRRPVCKVELSAGAAVPQGSRNDTIARLAGRLLRRNVDGDLVLDLMLAFNEARCVPPLPEVEVKRTVESIARIDMARRAMASSPPQTPAVPSP